MKFRLILIIFLVLNTTEIYSQASWTDQLEYGNYSVGFQVVEDHDFSRLYRTEYDSLLIPRPMLIGIWYPSEISKESNPVTFGYLLALETAEETLEKIQPQDVKAPSKKYEQYFTPDKIDKVFNKPMKANLDASHSKGKFPVIIYGSAQGSSGYDNAILCEQLASHGYIVATVASKGAYSRQMPFNPEGAEAQSRDLEFLYGNLYNYPFSDPKNIGLLGFSFGGLNTITFSLKNTQVKAIVSFDGSISSPAGNQILNSYSYLDPNNFNSNFLGFLGDKSQINNFPLFDQALLADMYLLKLSQLNHLDFSSFNLKIFDRPKDIYDAYVDMANLTVKFMNQNFKEDFAFEKAIANYSKNIYTAIREKKSKGSPQVTKEEYINYIKQNGIDKGIQVYYGTKKVFPEYKLFDYDAFRDVGFLKMIEKDYENAIKVYKVLIEEFPNNSDSYRRLGEAYMEHGNYDEARRLINSGLQLDPESPAMKDILRIINERDKK